MPDQEPHQPPADRGATSAPTPGTAQAGASSGTTAPGGGPHRRTGAVAVLVPAVTFVVGLLLGGALVWAGGDQDGDTAAGAPTPTASASAPTTSPSARPDSTVTVPGSCLEMADSAEVAADLVQDAAGAAQELDAAELSSIVRELQESRSDIEALSSACRAEAGSS